MLMTHCRKNPALRPSPIQSPQQALRQYRNTCRDTYLIGGFSLVEVLVTIVILLIGLLGLAGLQARALTVQMEAYQRSQALVLLKDMVDRIDTNRANAAAYVTTGLTPYEYLGTDNAIETAALCAAKPTWQKRDSCEWNNALLGAAETQGTSKIGAMIGARGCITQIAAAASGVPGEFLIAVAWQGFNSTAAPPSILCGKDKYSDEKLRRVVALPISIANLSSP